MVYIHKRTIIISIVLIEIKETVRQVNQGYLRAAFHKQNTTEIATE